MAHAFEGAGIVSVDPTMDVVNVLVGREKVLTLTPARG